jgi:hypothetical protein
MTPLVPAIWMTPSFVEVRPRNPGYSAFFSDICNQSKSVLSAATDLAMLGSPLP